MTPKERHTYILLWVFAVVSIATGLIVHTDLPDSTYYIGEQLSEILLLYVLYTFIPNKNIRVLLKGLLFLSFSEMIDEVSGKNLSFRVNDYVLAFVVLYIVYKTVKNGRDKR